MNKVAITVLNYNTYQYTIACVESILQQEYKDYTIFIVDNNSTNDSVSKISDFLNNMKENILITDESDTGESWSEYKLVFIKSNNNNGYAAGNNIALSKVVRKLDFEYYWVINNDTIVEKDTLLLMVNTLEKDIYNRPVGNFVYYYDDKNTMQMAGGLSFNSNFKPYFCMDEKKVDYLGGVSYLINNDFIERYGLMYEGYFLNSEDLEYFYQHKIDFMNKNKNELPFNVVGKIYHKESATQGKVSPMSNYYYSRNLLYSCRKFKKKKLINLYLYFMIRIIKWSIVDIKMAKSILMAMRDYRNGIKGKIDYFSK